MRITSDFIKNEKHRTAIRTYKKIIETCWIIIVHLVVAIIIW